MFIKNNKNVDRRVRHIRVRKKVSGTEERPRLDVYKSLNQTYAQIINDINGFTLVSASSIEKELAAKLEGKNKTEKASVIGEVIAKRAIEKNIKKVVFDRGGYIYTGRVKALAEAARNAGLEF